MSTISITVKKHIEATTELFFLEYGKKPKEVKKLFIHWYIQRHKAPTIVLIHDISRYYLELPEDEVIKILNSNNERT